MKNVCLVGVGPHAKRIYIQYFKKYNLVPKLIIELESKKDSTIKYLESQGIDGYKIFTINDKYKDKKKLNKRISERLKSICLELNITHAFISTEPKAHYSYLEFFITNKIDVLSDKPITVSTNMMSLRNIKAIKTDYEYLQNLAKENHVNCQIMCQRTLHKGYMFIKQLLSEVVSCYHMPVTFIEIFHSDGKWMMPHDLECENHPYKYGYGKLFHSGYHFIQLLTDFVKINDLIKDESKLITNCGIKSTFFTPDDELAVINFNDYKSLFKDQKVPSFYNCQLQEFRNFGEKNNYSLLTFRNKDYCTITVAELNLLQNSFSRRAWIETKQDEYKGNGRIRHEYVNIEVGPLMNIQVHSYQSKEICDRTENEYDFGGLEHFDIDIYRNKGLIGGKEYERIRLKDLYEHDENKSKGYNEKAREDFITLFLENKTNICSIESHKLAIDILEQLCLSLREYNLKNETTNKNFIIGGEN